MSEQLPNLDFALFDVPPAVTRSSEHKPRILLLYGSTRERSFSRLLVEEAAPLLEHFGARRGSSIHRACRSLTMCL